MQNLQSKGRISQRSHNITTCLLLYKPIYLFKFTNQILSVPLTDQTSMEQRSRKMRMKIDRGHAGNTLY